MQEILDIVKSKAQIRQIEQKERLSCASYIIEEMTVRLAGFFGNKEAQPRSVWDYFPILFEDERKEADEAAEKDTLAMIKDSRYCFAAAHNRAREKERSRDGIV